MKDPRAVVKRVGQRDVGEGRAGWCYNAVRIQVSTWMDLEGIMLSEMRQRKTNTL